MFKLIRKLLICFYIFLPVLSSAQNVESLAQLSQKVRPDFYIGSFAYGLSAGKENNTLLTEFFKRNFNIMTVGVYMISNQPEYNKYNFEESDYLVEFARVNDIKVYFHPLIAGAQYSPDWLNKGNFTKEQLGIIMRDRISEILTRYKGKFQYVDVVNEALDGTGMTADGQFDWLEQVSDRQHVWMKTMGMYQGKKYLFPQYLVDAFRIAREVGDKDLKLILNEWGNAMTTSIKGLSFIALIKAMREEGISVDGAGIQLHCFIKDGKLYEWGNVAFDFDAFDAMLNQYKMAGIDVHITEFDIHLPQNPVAGDFQLQGKYYAEILKHVIQSQAVKTFKTWGFTDRHSWKADGKDGHPLLLDESLKPKPAYIRQIELLKSLIKSTH